MKLSAMLAAEGVSPTDIRGNPEVLGMTMDSRRVSPGAIFVCTPGLGSDPHSYLAEARYGGAVAALVYSAAGLEAAAANGLDAAQLESDPTRFGDQIWRICDTFFEHPTRRMKVFGVTGTNGKSTTASLIRDLLRGQGLNAAYIGTLGFEIAGEKRELPNTTPFAVDLYNMLAEARDKGVEAVAMEVSSHALAEHRADGLEFDVGVFTNLTREHLDYHGDMDRYASAKLRLFSELPKHSAKRFVGVFNADDPTGLACLARFGGLGFGLDSCAYRPFLHGVDASVGLERISLTLEADAGARAHASARLGGGYNLCNLLCAAAGILALEKKIGRSELQMVAELLTGVRPVPGRFEAVPNEAGIGILVDYAHTPDALTVLLTTVRDLTTGKIITVFGCGGDRDGGKRPLMGSVVSELSDETIVTSDNPRTEDPREILRQIEAGIVPGRTWTAILDRSEAIAVAVARAAPGDVVVIAGKGHENYQIVGKTKYPMDDRELARAGLAARGRL